MAVESPPAFEQGSTYGAEQTRRTIASLLARGASIGSIVGGLVGFGDMEVTAGSGMQVKIAPGEAWIPGTSAATQSGYYARVSSSTALAIATSSESNPRIDTIVAKVIDKAYAGSEETFSVAVVTGTAEAGATLANKKGAGAVPASSLVLAYVLVPAKASSISGGNIENVAVTLPQGFESIRVASGNTTVKAGETVVMIGTSATVTVASLMEGQTATIWNLGEAMTVTGTGQKITGDFVSEATSVTLTSHQHLTFFSESARLLINAGEPKRKQVYVHKVFTKAEAEAGVEASPSRPAIVSLKCLESPKPVTVGGIEVGEVQSTGVWQPVYLLPGQKWKTETAVSSATLLL